MEDFKNEFAKRDKLAAHLGIEFEEVALGYAKLSLVVEDFHLNGADVLHGGTIFSLADTAFAAASNSHGKLALAVSASINFLKATPKGEKIYAEAKELGLSNKTGHYCVEVRNSKDILISSFTGTVYRLDKKYPQ